uniref:Reverse transcriptase domain-containing protein n=1 Tax=Tanacetum cinerariifolium TaxID=118510 RepID=A0A6L2JS63_TANCI|nr:reverse transcriptase domain-containing protein [Tanacetum cinerariifolium]
MDDEPMWATDLVVAPTPGSAITILEIANEFSIKEIRAFSEHEKKSLTDAWLRMKEMLRNCHGHNLSKGNIIKIFYHGLSEITQEVLNAAAGDIFLNKTPNQAYQLLEDKVSLKLDWAKNPKTKSSLKKTVAFTDEGRSNTDTDKIMARMDAMTIKMDAQYKELQSRAKKPTPDLDDDDMPMSREEQAKFMQTFSDLGASINLMPYFLYAKLSLETLKPTEMSVRLADRSFQYPVGIAKNMLVEKQLNLGVGTKRMIFNIDSAMKHSYSNDDTCFSIDDINEILEEDFDALLDEGRKILHSIEGNLFKEEIFAEFDEFMVMTVDENSEFESDTEEPPFEKITINTDYKIETSLEEPPKDLKLKTLPDNLEYVFLKEPYFLPVIISSKLSTQNKSKLISILKKHKETFAWKTTDILGIYPSFCKHKIQLLDDKKPVV